MSRRLPLMLEELLNQDTTIPSKDKVFRALQYFNPSETKVIIIGQDPYPNVDNANGLAFSVEKNQKLPQTLRNIFTELSNDLGIDNFDGDLEGWAKQGVLLLNSILTTEAGESGIHKGLGWEHVTDTFIQRAIDYNNPLVIIAWGEYAKEKLKSLKLRDRILILRGGHPSPSGNPQKNFFGGKYFSETNKFLRNHNIKEIDWKL